MLGESALDDAGAMVEEVDKLLRVQNLEFLLLGQLVRRRCKEGEDKKIIIIKPMNNTEGIMTPHILDYLSPSQVVVPSSSTFWSGVSA